MSTGHYWSSDKLTPENIAQVKREYSLRVPMTQIRNHTGLSLYYIRQIIRGIEVPTDGKHRPTRPDVIPYVEHQKTNEALEKEIIVPIQPKRSPQPDVVLPLPI